MAQHNYGDMKPTDSLSTVPSCTKADTGHVLNPVCPHNPFASHLDPNTLVSPCPHSGEHLLKESAEDITIEFWSFYSILLLQHVQSDNSMFG